MRFSKLVSLMSVTMLLGAYALSAQDATAELTPEITPELTPEATAEPAGIPYLAPLVIAQFPHSTSDFTQGLVWSDGELFQSTGYYGQSRLQQLDLEAGTTLQEVSLDEAFFGEGLALVDDTLVQITWQEGTAFAYDADTFALTDTYSYEGEGWGLCYDGVDLWMSDGSPNLFRRDSETFAVEDTVPVTLFGSPVSQINELECVDGTVYANLWQQDFIVQIDPATGEVIAVIDGSRLIDPAVRQTFSSGAVLNGIAYIPERDTFLLTGKLWPAIFEVTFDQVGELIPRAQG